MLVIEFLHVYYKLQNDENHFLYLLKISIALVLQRNGDIVMPLSKIKVKSYVLLNKTFTTTPFIISFLYLLKKYHSSY